jgi:hypothetical protein
VEATLARDQHQHPGTSQSAAALHTITTFPSTREKITVSLDGVQILAGDVSVPSIAYFYVTSSTGPHRPQPFAQVLIGPHVQRRGEAGSGDHTYAFAARIGGGIDVPLKSHFELRAIQIDWFLTQFANAKNDRQNNLLVAAGITYLVREEVAPRRERWAQTSCSPPTPSPFRSPARKAQKTDDPDTGSSTSANSRHNSS